MAAKTNAKRLTAAVLVLALLISVFPATILSAGAASNIGKIVLKDVKLRDSASSSAGYNFMMPQNWLVEIVSSSGTGNDLWYKVKAKNPEPNTGYIKEGYVLGSCLQILTDKGYADWVAAKKPDQGTFESTADGSAPAATATASAAPTSGAAEESVNPSVSPTVAATGYVKLILTSANLRDAAEGKKVNEWLPKNGLVMPYLEAPTTKGNYKWYNIRFIDNKTYFVRSDTVSLCDVNGNLISDPTITANPGGVVGGAGTIRITKSDVNLRKTEGGAVVGKLNRNTELSYTSVSSKGGYTWYYVQTTAGVRGYVRGDCCTVISGSTAAADPQRRHHDRDFRFLHADDG